METEEGEIGALEEGMIPRPPPRHREMDPADAMGYDDGDFRARGFQRRQLFGGPPRRPWLSRGPPPMMGPPPMGFRDFGVGPRIMVSPRGPPAVAGPRDSYPTPKDDEAARQAAERAKLEREQEELNSKLRELTRYVSVQDAMRSLDTVCQDLKKAIKKLEKLFKMIRAKKGDGIEGYPECFQYAKKVHEGLKSVHVVASTSMSHTHSMEAVVGLFRAAMNYRHDVLSAAQKQELEGWVRNSRVLKVIIEEKEREKAARQGGSAAPDGQASGQQQQQDTVSAGAPGQDKDQEPGALQQDAAGQAADSAGPQEGTANQGGDAAGQAPPGQEPGEAPPPPPAEPYPDIQEPLSEEGQAEAGPGSQPPLPGVVNLSSARPRSASTAGAFKMKIVVESTPDDIYKQQQQEQQQQQQQQRQHQEGTADMAVDAQPLGATLGGTDRRGAAGEGGQQQQRQEQRSLQQQLAQAQAQALAAAKQQHQQPNQQGSGFDAEPMSVDPADGRQHGGRDGEQGGRSSKRPRGGEEMQHHHRHGRSRSRSPGGDGGRDREGSPSDRDMPGTHSPMSGGDSPAFANGYATHGRGRPREGGWSYQERERFRMERERLEGRDMGHSMERDRPTEEASMLLRRGRLALVLDLDNTLLASSRFAELDTDTEELLMERLTTEASMLPDHQRELYRSERLGVWTKMRPGVREFLQRAVDKFELWAYSSGSRPYAEAMASLLDPEDRYFGGRIIAAGGGVDGPDGPSALHNKRLIAGLEQRRQVSLALADAGAVWPGDSRIAFLVVEQYLFFPTSRRRFGLEGRSLLEINRDECPDRGMLMTAYHLVERLHSLVFTYLHHPGPAGQLLSAPPADPRLAPWDVRIVLADERRKVLQGVCISFSRVFPRDADAHRHPLWCMAEAFGASCDLECSERTTHVISTVRGTEKTLWAAQHGRPVVTPAWLECCCTLWRKANEERFATPPQP